MSLKYVDDMTIIDNTSGSDVTKLQSTLDEFSEWARKNDKKLNPDKCVNMNVSFMKQPTQFPSLQICSKDLNVVNHIKILGVTI